MALYPSFSCISLTLPRLFFDKEEPFYSKVKNFLNSPPNIDFGKAVLGWNLKDTDCGNYNVLSPSSISNWIIVNQDQKTKQFEDYMTLTFSEADAVSGQVTIRGVLNYVLQIYNQKEIKDTFTIDIDASAIVRKTSKCVDDGCRDECKRYGLEHPEPKKEEDKKKNN